MSITVQLSKGRLPVISQLQMALIRLIIATAPGYSAIGYPWILSGLVHPTMWGTRGHGIAKLASITPIANDNWDSTKTCRAFNGIYS